jgi:hypothetical protein
MEPTGQHPEENGRIEALITGADALADTVQELGATLRRSRRFGIVTAFGLVLDVTITIILATVLNGQAAQNRKIQNSLNQDYITQQQQEQTRVKVLCPLYGLLVTGSTPPPGATSAELKQYTATLGIIKTGYVALGCTPPLPAAR